MVQGSPLYFEVTANGDYNQIYVDTYNKISNHAYLLNEE